MRRLILTLVCAQLLIAIGSQTALGQDEASKEQLFHAFEHVVKPSMVTQYEAKRKEWVSQLKKHSIAATPFVVLSSEDFHYVSLMAVKDFAGVEELEWGWEELKEKMGEEEFGTMIEGRADAFETHRFYFVTLMYEHSYTSNNPEESKAGMNFRNWEFYHLRPWTGRKWLDIAEKLVALYQEKNVPTSFRTYLETYGGAVPLHIITRTAKSAADFYEQQSKDEKLLGEEGEKLMQEFMAITRRFERKNGAFRPELSYAPQDK